MAGRLSFDSANGGGEGFGLRPSISCDAQMHGFVFESCGNTPRPQRMRPCLRFLTKRPLYAPSEGNPGTDHSVIRACFGREAAQ